MFNKAGITKQCLTGQHLQVMFNRAFARHFLLLSTRNPKTMHVSRKTTRCGIAGFQCHAIQNKNQNCSIDEVQNLRKKKEGNYAKTLAKIQVTAIFLLQDMRRRFFPKFIEICMETP